MTHVIFIYPFQWMDHDVHEAFRIDQPALLICECHLAA